MSAIVSASADIYATHPYASSLLVHGGYAFICYMDSAHHMHIVRYSETTMVSDGDIDLGATDDTSQSHVFPSLLLDPTDDGLLVTQSGYYKTDGDARCKICKSAHALGGTAEEWIDNDFGTWSDIPLPATGIVAYSPQVFLSNGTLVMLGSNRTSFGNGDPAGERNLMVYRYVGDGTSKTAAQLASGSWIDLVGQPDDTPDCPEGAEWLAGTMYPGGTPSIKGTVGIGITFHTYFARGGTGDSSDRWGCAYLYTDDITATTPAWKKADGTTFTPGTNYDSTARSDSVLTVYAGSADYFSSLVYSGSTPYIAYSRFALDASYLTESDYELHVAYWNGSAWTDAEIHSGAITYIPKMLLIDGVFYIATYGGYIVSNRLNTWDAAETEAHGTTGGWAQAFISADASQSLYAWTEQNDDTVTYTLKMEGMSFFTASFDIDHIDLSWSSEILTPPYLIERRVV